MPINSFYERGGYSTKTKEISMLHRLVYLCAIQVDKLRGFRAPVETEIVSGKRRESSSFLSFSDRVLESRFSKLYSSRRRGG